MNDKYNPRVVEKKWQRFWEDEALFEAQENLHHPRCGSQHGRFRHPMSRQQIGRIVQEIFEK